MKIAFLSFPMLGALALLWLWLRDPNALASDTAVPSGANHRDPAMLDDLSKKREPSEQPNRASPERLAKFKDAFNTAIDLHGKVVDQHGSTVPEAVISFSIQGFAGKAKERVTSNGDGRFRIAGYRGGTLGIEVTKAGYRQLPYSETGRTSAAMLHYGLGSSNSNSASDPMEFTLYKPGPIEQLIKVGERNFRIPRDGTPIAIDLDPGQPGKYPIRLRCWNRDQEPRPKGEHRYEWKLELTALNGGGLVERTDVMDFEAPDDGYLPAAEISMPVDAKPVWSSSAERHYFVRFGDGVFGRVAIEMIAGGDHFVVWESHLNPKRGSRNLDTDPDRR